MTTAIAKLKPLGSRIPRGFLLQWIPPEFRALPVEGRFSCYVNGLPGEVLMIACIQSANSCMCRMAIR